MEKNRISEPYYLCCYRQALEGAVLIIFKMGYLYYVWCSEGDKTHLMWCHLTVHFVVLYTCNGDPKLKFSSEYEICSVLFLCDYNTFIYITIY